MFLLDQNLPIRLAKALQVEFPGTVHVKDAGLATASDARFGIAPGKAP